MPWRSGECVARVDPRGRLRLALRVVERKRPVLVLTVYTGDPKHKVRLSRRVASPVHRELC